MHRSNWTVFHGALQVAALVTLSAPTTPLRADTIFNSGDTTVSTETDFGSTLTVASTGTATLTIVDGAYATNETGYVGSAAGSFGTVTVSGGTWATSNDLSVGYDGGGRLEVKGGLVTNANANVGSNAGGTGLALVQSGTWVTSDFLVVGKSGTGQLFVTGGLATSRVGVLGFDAGGLGTATVSFGTWDNSDFLSVGGNGEGTLNVTGGRVTTPNAYLGDGSGVGTAAVSSGTWDMNAGLFVGYSGTGTLSMTGGRVTNTNASIGTDAGSIGTATVSGGTWASSGDLAVGSSGTGTLTITGGLVSVAGTLSKGAEGTINLNPGGTLQIGTGGTTGVLLGGTGGLTNNGTLIFNRFDASTYSGIISGTGVVTKQGVGTLTLSGNNSYAGGTTISDGVLALGSADAVGASGTISFGGGTLQYSASNTTDYSSRFSTAASQAYEIHTNSQNVTLAAPLSSSGGTLTKFGAGTLTLLGNNSYTGGTTISDGTLQIGVGGTTGSITGDVVNNSALVLSRSDASTYSGVISGTGSLTKQGSGTLTLSGSNSYAGGTTISAGTLQVGAGGTTGSIAGDVVNDAFLVFNRSNASTYSGVISGTGTIQNDGTGTTTLTGQTSFTSGLGATAGWLIVGSTASVNGFSTTGSLAAASGATLELKSKGLAYVNGLSTLTGGTIVAANGISLGAGANVLGAGVISGRIAATAGSRVEASGGRLTLGDAASYSGIYSVGELYTNANEVELLDRNLAVLGSLTQLGDGSAGGTLRAANGMLLEQGKNLVGRGTVYGNFVNQGDVYGDGSAPGQKIVFAAGSTVSGIGSFENVVFGGTYSPGNSPAITNLTNGEFSSASTLLIELGGTQPGTAYDRVVDSGVLTLLGGTLNVVPYNGFAPSFGDSFEILQYGQLSGDFGTVNYSALGGGLSWQRTTSATAMTITVVPEPSTYAISATATAGLASLMWWRKRRAANVVA
jgi:autotransporter-associated beta strand protein/T5SS/PEP-CTERM-associated repeat protein